MVVDGRNTTDGQKVEPWVAAIKRLWDDPE